MDWSMDFVPLILYSILSILIWEIITRMRND